MTYKTLDHWIQQEAMPFSLDAPDTFYAAVDRMLAMMGDSVRLLGLGETLHGGEDILMLRNRLFQRLVEKHGYSAIAIESSFPKGRLVNDYVTGQGAEPLETVMADGFSHGFVGQLETSRELVEWMREYNADPSHAVKLHFYGFDSPTEMTSTDSPRQLLDFALDYLTALDAASGQERRQRVEALLGADADWENPAAMMDPSQSVGLSPNATALRIETEDLITELKRRRPELVAKSDARRFQEGVHDAESARSLLDYHAGLAGHSANRTAELLGVRDMMMADNLAYMVAQEHERGKVFVFAHNSHLRRGIAKWQLGADLLTWWPSGAQISEILGAGYAVIGSALGVSEANGIGQPEAGTLEAKLVAAPGPVRFIPTHKGQGLPEAKIATLPTRSGSSKNYSYFPLTAESLADFDWLAVLDSTTYQRGGSPLPG